MTTIAQPNTLKSPMSDEQFKSLKQLAANKVNTMEMIDRLEKTGAYTPEAIKELRDKAIDTYTKASAVVTVFQDLHPGI